MKEAGTAKYIENSSAEYWKTTTENQSSTPLPPESATAFHGSQVT